MMRAGLVFCAVVAVVGNGCGKPAPVGEASPTGAQPPLVVPLANPAPAPARKDAELAPEARRQKIAARIRAADEAIVRHRDRCLTDLRATITGRKAAARTFADTALSLRSKGLLVWSKLPWTDEETHRRFLAGRFSSEVLSGEDLEKAITTCVTEFIRGVEDEEARLLVDLRADLDDAPGGAARPGQSQSEVVAAFRKKVQEVARRGAPATAASAGIDAVALAGGLVAAKLAEVIVPRVLAAIATRLGVSGALGTGGAAAGPLTLGVSVIAALVVDYLVGLALDAWLDPTGKVADAVCDGLDELAKLVTDGDPKTRGLRTDLDAVTAARKAYRDTALREWFQER
jgi:hypothetical protein